MVFMFIVKSAGRKLHTTIKELTFSSNMALYEKAILGVFFINFKRKNQAWFQRANNIKPIKFNVIQFGLGKKYLCFLGSFLCTFYFIHNLINLILGYCGKYG